GRLVVPGAEGRARVEPHDGLAVGELHGAVAGRDPQGPGAHGLEARAVVGQVVEVGQVVPRAHEAQLDHLVEVGDQLRAAVGQLDLLQPAAAQLPQPGGLGRLAGHPRHAEHLHSVGGAARPLAGRDAALATAASRVTISNPRRVPSRRKNSMSAVRVRPPRLRLPYSLVAARIIVSARQAGTRPSPKRRSIADRMLPGGLTTPPGTTSTPGTSLTLEWTSAGRPRS